MTGVLFGIAARSSPEAPPLSAALRDTPAGIAPDLIERTAHGGSETTSGMPRESLDVPEDLPKQAARQVALGHGRIKCRACGRGARRSLE